MIMGPDFREKSVEILGFGEGDLMEREHLEDLIVDMSVILKRIFKE
jgi:hypothetical protein